MLLGNPTMEQEDRHNKKKSCNSKWLLCDHPVGIHKGFCVIQILQQNPWDQYEKKKEPHGGIESLTEESGPEVSKAFCT